MTALELLISTSLILFFIAVLGVLVRRNIIVILMCLELMLNAVNLALVTFSRSHGNLDGQVTVLMIFVVAAAEVAIGVSIIINLFKHKETISFDRFNLLRR